MKKGITFETKCWQGDWEVLLKTDYLEKQIRNCNFEFDKKRLIINNVDNLDEVLSYAQRAVDKGVIDEYIIVAEYSDEVLSFYNLSKEQLGKGYYYSIAELVGIFVCDTQYLLHFSSDSFLENNNKNNFVKDSLELLEAREDIAVVNPIWNYRYKEISNPNYDSSKKFHIGNGFSDQCYLIRANEFKRCIYHFRHESGKAYPGYGGELFEKRCNNYMRCNGKFRATYLKNSYWTENIRGLRRYKYKKILSAIVRMIYKISWHNEMK